jgi:hypothetical protein
MQVYGSWSASPTRSTAGNTSSSLVGRNTAHVACQLALSSYYGVGVPEYAVEQFSDPQERSNAISHAMLPDPLPLCLRDGPAASGSCTLPAVRARHRQIF